MISNDVGHSFFGNDQLTLFENQMQSLSEIFQNLNTQGLANDPTVYFIPGFIFLILLELVLSAKQQLNVHDPKDSLASIGMGIGSLVIGVGVKTVAFGIMMYLYQFDVLGLTFFKFSV